MLKNETPEKPIEYRRIKRLDNENANVLYSVILPSQPPKNHLKKETLYKSIGYDMAFKYREKPNE